MTDRTYKKGRPVARIALVIAAALLMSGCWRAHQLESLCDEIASECPGAHFTRDFSVSLGPFSMGLIRFATGFSDDTREAREYLSGISRVQIAVYKASSVSNAKNLKLPQELRDLVEEDGWEIAVRASERDESAWMIYREDDGKIRDMLITALDHEELVALRVSGHLNELFELAMKEDRPLANVIRNKVAAHKSKWNDSSNGE